MASACNVFRAPRKYAPMEELREARLVADFGLEGCAHAKADSGRQVLLVDRETLEAMELTAGILGENITTDGLNVNSLQIGQRLRIGDARLEVTMVCTPCNQMERIRPGLRKELWGRRGMLCRVLEAGIIRPGDAIEKLPASEETIPAIDRVRRLRKSNKLAGLRTKDLIHEGHKY